MNEEPVFLDRALELLGSSAAELARALQHSAADGGGRQRLCNTVQHPSRLPAGQTRPEKPGERGHLNRRLLPPIPKK
jgi:Mn-dependent DtxR family transcriptional regulator